MNLSIELPDELGAAVKAQARAQGISPDRYVSHVRQTTLGSKLEQPSLASHLKPDTACGPSMDPHHRLRRSMRTAERCSATSGTTSR